MTEVSRKLNVGCGRAPRPASEGWVNIDHPSSPFVQDRPEGVEVIGYDLETARYEQLPLRPDSFDVIECTHVLEHVRDLLPLLQELWRVAKPGGKLVLAAPHGASDDAWEDPTHVRAFFPGSWAYFGQPVYWKADYGYRGDWKPDFCILYVDAMRYPKANLQAEMIQSDLRFTRNVVFEMRAQFTAIKPARQWDEEAEMDTWRTAVELVGGPDAPKVDPNEARAQRIAKGDGLWTP